MYSGLSHRGSYTPRVG